MLAAQDHQVEKQTGTQAATNLWVRAVTGDITRGAQRRHLTWVGAQTQRESFSNKGTQAIHRMRALSHAGSRHRELPETWWPEIVVPAESFGQLHLAVLWQFERGARDGAGKARSPKVL